MKLQEWSRWASRVSPWTWLFIGFVCGWWGQMIYQGDWRFVIISIATIPSGVFMFWAFDRIAAAK